MRMGGLKCSLRSRAKQHDGEADSSANANLSRLNLNSQFPRQQTPHAKPMVLRQALPHSNTGHFLVIPVTQPLTGHIQNSSNTLPELCVPVLVVVSVASTSVPKLGTPGSLLAHLHPHSHLVFFLPSRAPVPSLAAPVGQSSHLSPAMLRPTTASRVGV